MIAELLDGPPPTGVRASAESPWAPQGPDDAFFIDDLMFGKPPPGVGAEPAGNGETTDDSGEAEGEGMAAATSSGTSEEQARIAADQARRRRSRRGGGRRKPPRRG